MSRYERRVQRSDGQGYVYFITCEQPDFPIKIGFASEVMRRMGSLQSGLPYPINILFWMPGNRKIERTFNRQFASINIRGEWFKNHPAIHDFIERLKHKYGVGIIPPRGMSKLTRLRLGIE
jgi:hypothetical protein